jgi:hypothetical protein
MVPVRGGNDDILADSWEIGHFERLALDIGCGGFI